MKIFDLKLKFKEEKPNHRPGKLYMNNNLCNFNKYNRLFIIYEIIYKKLIIYLVDEKIYNEYQNIRHR